MFLTLKEINEISYYTDTVYDFFVDLLYTSESTKMFIIFYNIVYNLKTETGH